ncbi:MAG: hypothetical protein KY466_04880 [Gemmatimonadetes bacterium]|nr:hypothetical protein [Gemmatimonadota bacterium]
MERRSTTLFHGAVGGLLAGAVVALWFLLVDVARGDPLATPELLARQLLGESTLPMVMAYTVLHFGVFAALGAAAAGFLAAAGLRPGLLVGAVIGVGALDAIYYGVLLTVDADLVTLLPGPHVLLANLAAGMVLATYLHRVSGEGAPLGPAVLRGHPLLTAGIVTGLVGGFAVAVWFLILDTFAGRPLYTPAALGSLVFLGASGPGEVQLSAAVIAGYTVLHFAVFAVAGLALTWVARQLERTPAFWLIAFMAFVILEGVFLGGALALGAWVLGAVGVWAVGVGNVVAVASMAGWLWGMRPELRRQFRAVPANTRV